MEFEQLTPIPWKIQRGEYTANPEVVDRVRQEVDAFVNRTGTTPAYLLLGYGTYFSLCITMTEYIHAYNSQRAPYMVEKLNYFDAIPILIDSGYEFRVSCIGRKNPFEDAVDIYFESKKLK